MRSKLALLLVLLSGSALVCAGVPEAVDPGQIPAYKVIAPGIVAAGQPAPEALPRLGAMGFQTVVNPRLPDEGGPADERSGVESQGLRYVSVPVTAASLSLADVAA